MLAEFCDYTMGVMYHIQSPLYSVRMWGYNLSKNWLLTIRTRSNDGRRRAMHANDYNVCMAGFFVGYSVIFSDALHRWTVRAFMHA